MAKRKRKLISNKEITFKILADAGYSLDSQGTVLGKMGRSLKPYTRLNGYQTIGLSFGSRGECTRFCYHRAVWMLANRKDIPADGQIDHINRNPSDNRPENLQLMANRAEHALKDQAGRSQSDTKPWSIANVIWHKQSGKWRVQFSVNGKGKTCGYFVDFQDACNHRNEIAAELGYAIVSQEAIDKAILAHSDFYNETK
tara:strand:- start:170 stop:766 length:597 start_codon:yes stop_codon:yes gene_type:complete